MHSLSPVRPQLWGKFRPKCNIWNINIQACMLFLSGSRPFPLFHAYLMFKDLFHAKSRFKGHGPQVDTVHLGSCSVGRSYFEVLLRRERLGCCNLGVVLFCFCFLSYVCCVCTQQINDLSLFTLYLFTNICMCLLCLCLIHKRELLKAMYKKVYMPWPVFPVFRASAHRPKGSGFDFWPMAHT